MADDRVKQVKQANDIVDVVGSYLALRPAGQTFKALCPFHDDSRPSFDVDPRRQRYRCWSCGKFGDVLSFVQEFEKVTFPEALTLLARRAGIELDSAGRLDQGPGRAHLLDVMRWAAKLFHDCLLEDPLAEDARRYLGERGLRGETVRRWGLGYAAGSGQWLAQHADRSGVALDLLEAVGLVAPRASGAGHYDRFRDRVLFPIRDVRGQTVGFGGRVLPGSSAAQRGPKYYNSCDSPLFSKSEQLYGIDQARPAAEKAGYLAIVEGYTDVLMAHQAGVGQVVATMGTALNARHVRQLRRFVPRVVLVFDADQGGDQGADRALEIFASHDIELSVATLPVGLDPCDLLVRDGADAFRRVLESAVDALEFKLRQMLAQPGADGVEGRRRVVDAVLGVIALAPPVPGEAGSVKAQLMVNRIARRLALKEETVWARLDELRGARRERGPTAQAPRGAAPALPEERRLLEVLLAEPGLVARAADEIPVEEIRHPGLGKLLAGLYELHAAGLDPTLDALRDRLDSSPLLDKAFELQDVGLAKTDRHAEFVGLLGHFRRRRDRTVTEDLQTRLYAATDERSAVELLRRLQNRTVEPGPDTSASRGSWEGEGPLAPSA